MNQSANPGGWSGQAQYAGTIVRRIEELVIRTDRIVSARSIAHIVQVTVQLDRERSVKKRPRKRIAVSASEARQIFLQLLQDVATDAVELVEISHRDLDERVVLVSEKRVRAWRRRVADLETRLRAQASTSPFRLVGSGTLNEDPDEFLAASRHEAAQAAEAKLGSL